MNALICAISETGHFMDMDEGFAPPSNDEMLWGQENYYTMWVKQVYTYKIANCFKNHLWTVNYYTSYERVFYSKSFSIIFVWYVLMLNEQEALFARVQKSTCAKVAYVMFE